MSPESPAEYIEQLRDEKRALRAAVVQLCHEKQALLEHIAKQDIWIKEMRSQLKVSPHDFEPARPGLEDVD